MSRDYRPRVGSSNEYPDQATNEYGQPEGDKRWPGRRVVPPFRGRAMSLPHRSEMERAFGTDFGDVEAFADPGAASSLGAQAFTIGNRVVFRDPDPSRELVAHELTHVIQQRGATTPMPAAKPAGAGLSSPGDAAEVEADHVAAAVVSGLPVPRISAAPGLVHRKVEGGRPHGNVEFKIPGVKIPTFRHNTQFGTLEFSGLISFGRKGNVVDVKDGAAFGEPSLSVLQNKIKYELPSFKRSWSETVLKFNGRGEILPGLSLTFEGKGFEIVSSSDGLDVRLGTAAFTVEGDVGNFLRALGVDVPPWVSCKLVGKGEIIITAADVQNLLEGRKLVKELAQRTRKTEEILAEVKKEKRLFSEWRRRRAEIQRILRHPEKIAAGADRITREGTILGLEIEHQGLRAATKARREGHLVALVKRLGDERVAIRRIEKALVRVGRGIKNGMARNALARAAKTTAKKAMSKLAATRVGKLLAHLIPGLNVVMILWDIYDGLAALINMSRYGVGFMGDGGPGDAGADGSPDAAKSADGAPADAQGVDGGVPGGTATHAAPDAQGGGPPPPMPGPDPGGRALRPGHGRSNHTASPDAGPAPHDAAPHTPGAGPGAAPDAGPPAPDAAPAPDAGAPAPAPDAGPPAPDAAPAPTTAPAVPAAPASPQAHDATTQPSKDAKTSKSAKDARSKRRKKRHKGRGKRVPRAAGRGKPHHVLPLGVADAADMVALDDHGSPILLPAARSSWTGGAFTVRGHSYEVEAVHLRASPATGHTWMCELVFDLVTSEGDEDVRSVETIDFVFDGRQVAATKEETFSWQPLVDRLAPGPTGAPTLRDPMQAVDFGVFQALVTVKPSSALGARRWFTTINLVPISIRPGPPRHIQDPSTGQWQLLQVGAMIKLGVELPELPAPPSPMALRSARRAGRG